MMALVTGIFLAQYGMLFTLISLVVTGFLLWFLCRRSYEIAFKHRIILTEKGVIWHYLGITGFASWDIIDIFDKDNENGWINLTFSTSDKHHTHVRIGSFHTNIPLKPYEVWGIRLSNSAQYNKSWLSNLPSSSRDFIPITLITNIPKNRQFINHEKFKETEFGQDLVHYAPHLFEDVKKPKNHLEKNYAIMEEQDIEQEAFFDEQTQTQKR